MRDTTAISELTGEPVSTWSDEWRNECELRYVLGLSPADRDAFFNGVKETGNRGIVALRGVAAAERFMADLARLQEIRAKRKQQYSATLQRTARSPACPHVVGSTSGSGGASMT